MTSRYSFLTRLALILAVAGCAKVDQPQTTFSTKSRNPGIQSNPSQRAIALSGEKYRNDDGSIDYNSLRQVYGEPNSNIELNPRATDVEKTTSVHSVVANDGELVFAANDAQWLLTNVHPGDTLYCGTACGNEFVRNVVSITQRGNMVSVATTVGWLNDIVRNGWLHGTEDVVIDIGKDEDSGRYYAQLRPRDLTFNGSVPSGGPQSLWSSSFSQPFPGGKITLSGSLTAQLNYDVAFSETCVGAFGLCANIPTGLDTFDVTAVITPSLTLAADWAATGSISKSGNLFSPITINLPPIPLGSVVTINPNIQITGTWKLDASGTVTAKATGTATDSVSAGFTYTGSAGWNPVANNTFTDSYDVSASGTASADASATLTIQLNAPVLSVAGPNVNAVAIVGATVTASASAEVSNKGSSCGANISAQMYFTLQANAGVAISIPVIFSPGYSHTWNIWNQTWKFPDPAWTANWSVNDAGTCFTEDAGPGGTGSGGGTGGTSGTTGSSGGTGTTSTTHGTNGSFGACGAGSACGAGQDCCSNGDGGAAQCVETPTNSQNCGTCGQECAIITGDATSACQSGLCTCTCPSGTIHAGQKCASTDITACDD